MEFIPEDQEMIDSINALAAGLGVNSGNMFLRCALLVSANKNTIPFKMENLPYYEEQMRRFYTQERVADMEKAPETFDTGRTEPPLATYPCTLTQDKVKDGILRVFFSYTNSDPRRYTPEVLEQLQRAATAIKPVYIYGASGTGKTSLAVIAARRFIWLYREKFDRLKPNDMYWARIPSRYSYGYLQEFKDVVESRRIIVIEDWGHLAGDWYYDMAKLIEGHIMTFYGCKGYPGCTIITSVHPPEEYAKEIICQGRKTMHTNILPKCEVIKL